MPLPDRPETEARDMTRYIYAIDMHKGLTVILMSTERVACYVHWTVVTLESLGSESGIS